MQKISNFITYCNDNNIQIDDAFIKISLFIFNDWRKLNNDLLYSKMMNYTFRVCKNIKKRLAKDKKFIFFQSFVIFSNIKFHGDLF